MCKCAIIQYRAHLRNSPESIPNHLVPSCLKLRRFAKEAPRRRLRALRVRLRRISPPLRFGAFPLRLCFAKHKHDQLANDKAIYSWGAAPNPGCGAYFLRFLGIRGVGRSPTLKIRTLRNMLIGSTARSIRRSGSGMRPSRSDRVARRSEATEPRSGCKGPRQLCKPSELTQTRQEVLCGEIRRCALGGEIATLVLVGGSKKVYNK